MVEHTATPESPAVQRLWKVVETAIDALRQGRQETAERHLAEAATLAEALDPAQRRDHLSALSVVMLRQGFSRQALPLAEAAIRIDERAGDWNHLCGDLIHYGWALAQEGRSRQATQAYESAIDLAVHRGRYADAAGACTNLGVLHLMEGRHDEADRLFERSLGWLERQPEPDNEIRTLIYRARGWDEAGRPPEDAIGLAEQTLARHGARMDDGHRNMMIGMLEKPLKRYFASHPDLDAQAWLRQHFAALNPK